ncbi:MULTISPECIES: response regulator transcription factor [Shouchella]|uniref:Response regulator transcription factor n=2 Tax=Shouchella TaxID=2893057 RepID=A0ABY7WB55_9BACI|nr:MULTISPECIES: response regulator transcription factor [Shouchella]MED4126591.1 response regulator transcription factor [Shouchella miscanthi]WDF04706.1 response regulator transcription factor [Shouchella hunanensis]GAF23967.1 two-component response regulator [Bacillus sp. JCM 19047]
MKLLLVEDDVIIVSGLEYTLQQEGYDVIVFNTVEKAASFIQHHVETIDVCLFDLNLPDGTGYDLCALVKQKCDIPVLFLTAIDDEGNVVKGLDMGADDYITKPFRVKELVSRLRTVLRRYERQSQRTEMYPFGPIEIHPLEGKVYRQQQEIHVTALEFRLLMIFAKHIGQVLSRDQLLHLIWDSAGEFVHDNTLTVYIKRLREKIEDDPQKPRLIITVRGLGYRVGS